MPQTPDAPRSFNNQLRATAIAVAGASADGHEYGFLCECGCGGTVRLVLAEYELQGGAWLDGHKPEQPSPSRLAE
jgi:hypothetical protein